MAEDTTWLRAGRMGRTSERLMFAIAGMLFCLGILGATVVLLERDKAVLLAEEAERGKLLSSALAGNISRAMAALESTLDALEHHFEGLAPGQAEGEERMANLAYRSTLLRSLSVVTPDGRVLASTARAHRGLRLDLASLGFTREILSSLEPGMTQFVRDIGHPQDAAVHMSASVSAIPFARATTIGDQQVILLAMVNPAALFLDARSGAGDESSFSAVFDYQGRVLAATRHSDFLPGRAYPLLPLPGNIEETAEYGGFRTAGAAVGESRAPFIVNYRSAGLYPLIAVTGRSEDHALAAWRAGSRNVMWLGLAAAVLVLLYTGMLWRVMGNRQKIECELMRARDAAEQANAARGVFLSTMSHEIRTPMNAVLGMAELLRDTPLNPEQEDCVRTLQDSASALLSIIDDVLDFSKIDAGKMTIEKVPVQLSVLARGSVDIIAIGARAKNLRLRVDVGTDVPAYVSADPSRLRQVLLNLLGNAVKFTEAGEVHLRVTRIASQGDQALIRFEVRDTGIGIDADTAARLFAPFTQADGSVTRRYGGTGLGLSICKQLVELMDGRIGLQSSPGQGSVFWFELPMQTTGETDEATLPRAIRTTPRPIAPTAPTAPIAHAPESGCRILVVDDNPMNQTVALRQLKQLGHRAEVAGNGEEAVAAVTAGDFELVLMDCQMPVMDGFEATRRIRALEAAGRPRVQIVAMTANAMHEDRQRCLEAGMDDYLSKPITREQLSGLLSRRLHGAAPAPAASEPPAAAQPALLNAAQLRATFGDDLAFQQEILALFLSTTRTVLDRMGAAVAARDFRLVQGFGHRLFGSCGTIGADSLAQLGRQAELAAQAGDGERLRVIHAQMLDTYRRLKEEIAALAGKTDVRPPAPASPHTVAIAP